MAATKMLSMAEFAGRKIGEDGKLVPRPERRPRGARKTIAASSFRKTVGETEEMISSGDWDGFAARHVLALYDLMHAKCYGVAPEMTSEERHRMVLLAGAFAKRHFDRDFAAVVEYFRWLWDREISRTKWKVENGREVRRLSFVWSISMALLTDYRVALAQKRTRRA